MNIETIANLLCDTRRLIQVLGSLSPRAKSELKDKLEQDAGLHLQALDRDLAEQKSLLLVQNQAGFEAMAAVSIEHLCMAAREALAQGEFLQAYGILNYPNDYGGFLYFGGMDAGWQQSAKSGVPTSVLELARWAKAHHLVWVKIDCDARHVPDLARYQDADVPADSVAA